MQPYVVVNSKVPKSDALRLVKGCTNRRSAHIATMARLASLLIEDLTRHRRSALALFHGMRLVKHGMVHSPL